MVVRSICARPFAPTAVYASSNSPSVVVVNAGKPPLTDSEQKLNAAFQSMVCPPSDHVAYRLPNRLARLRFARFAPLLADTGVGELKLPIPVALTEALP